MKYELIGCIHQGVARDHQNMWAQRAPPPCSKGLMNGPDSWADGYFVDKSYVICKILIDKLTVFGEIFSSLNNFNVCQHLFSFFAQSQ